MTSWLSNITLHKLLDLAGLHCTTLERSDPSLHRMCHDFLSRPLPFLDWTSAMLFSLDFHYAQSNLYRWFRMQQHDWSLANPKRAHVTPLFISLHWLQVAARIKFKTLMLAYRTATGCPMSCLLSDNITRTLCSIWLVSQFSKSCYDDFSGSHQLSWKLSIQGP